MSEIVQYTVDSPEALLGISGTNTTFLQRWYKLTANIDFKKAKFGDGSPAWFNEERPYSEFGSGVGVLKWCPKLFTGAFIKKNISAFSIDTEYSFAQIVIFDGEYWWWNDYSTASHVAPDDEVPGNYWTLIDPWSTGEYTFGDHVTHEGSVWIAYPMTEYTSTEPGTYHEFDFGGGPEQVTDWTEVPTFSTVTSLLSYTPFVPESLEEAETVEEYMGDTGYWSGMQCIGSYLPSKPFLGTFDFNGFEILNLYMVHLLADDGATVPSGDTYNTCSRTALFPSMEIEQNPFDSTDVTDVFLGSNPVMRNSCVMAYNAPSVLTNYDTIADNVSFRRDITGDIDLLDCFSLCQTTLNSFLMVNVSWTWSGTVTLTGKLVTLQRKAVYEDARTGFIAGGWFNPMSGGDEVTPIQMGDFRMSGEIMSPKPIGDVGAFGRITPSSDVADWRFGSMEVDITITAPAGSASVQELDGSNGGVVGIFRNLGSPITTSILFDKLRVKCVMNIGDSGTVQDISAVFGSVFPGWVIHVNDLVVEADLANSGGDSYAIVANDAGECVTVDNCYVRCNSLLDGGTVVAERLTSAKMLYQSNFPDLDFTDRWKLGRTSPVPQSLNKVLKRGSFSGGSAFKAYSVERVLTDGGQIL